MPRDSPSGIEGPDRTSDTDRDRHKCGAPHRGLTSMKHPQIGLLAEHETYNDPGSVYAFRRNRIALPSVLNWQSYRKYRPAYRSNNEADYENVHSTTRF